MHPGLKRTLAAAVLAPGLIFVTLGVGRSAADEPRGLGRIFRFGSNSTATTPAPAPAATDPLSADTGAPGPTAPAPNVPAAQPGNASAPIAPAPRIVPQPRTNRPVTEADPLLSRVSLVRSNDGNQFGVFLQVFADGTIIDGEGVHHVGYDALKPILDIIQDSDLYRLRGHCGAPSTDFTEYVHLTVFERSFGKLRANSFSYSGNPQGCDQSVRLLHAALDTLQTKLSRPAAGVPGPAPTENTVAPRSNSASSIPLSPAH